MAKDEIDKSLERAGRLGESLVAMQDTDGWRWLSEIIQERIRSLGDISTVIDPSEVACRKAAIEAYRSILGEMQAAIDAGLQANLISSGQLTDKY